MVVVAAGQTASSAAAPAGDPCAQSTLGPGLSTRQISSGGLDRTALLYLPRGFKPSTPISLVLNLHGSGSSPKQQLDRSGIMATADHDGFAVLAPQAGMPASSGRHQGGYVWHIPGVALLDGRQVPPDAPDDMRFLRDSITAMSHVLCLDTRRIYVTGFSGGGRMTSQLGCELSSRIAAIAPVSGLRFPPDCRPGRPEPVITFHGTADEVNPYPGGRNPRWRASIPEVTRSWAKVDHCGQVPVEARVTPKVTSTSYVGCPRGGDVVLYTITGGRHVWPENANELIWSFFQRHPLNP